MSMVSGTPNNLNYLSPLNFRFLIKKAPHVNFFIQRVDIPGFSLQSVQTPNPFVKIPFPGEHLDYEELEIEFKVDEDLKNYLEIHNWIRSLGKPHDFDEYKEIQDKKSWSGDGIYSDISITILSNIKNYNYEITFIDAHPVSLSGLSFITTPDNIDYLEARARFKYTYYNITNI